MQAVESRAAPTLLAGLLQGESIKIRLIYNDSSENLVVFGERIQGPTVKAVKSILQASMTTVNLSFSRFPRTRIVRFYSKHGSDHVKSCEQHIGI